MNVILFPIVVVNVISCGFTLYHQTLRLDMCITSNQRTLQLTQCTCDLYILQFLLPEAEAELRLRVIRIILHKQQWFWMSNNQHASKPFMEAIYQSPLLLILILITSIYSVNMRYIEWQLLVDCIAQLDGLIYSSQAGQEQLLYTISQWLFTQVSM